ncbi:MAG: biotin carboxylase, partial [Gammaproteobacteria bacterium]|nr:biotin carboxylase [Gammaproteobacteria bacterium]
MRLIIASDGAHSVVPEIADGMHVDLRSAEEAAMRLAAGLADTAIDAVLAADDVTVEIASRAAAALGRAHNPVAAVRSARRKDLARAALAAAGVPVPEFRRLDLARPLGAQIAGVRFPCVVKPLAMAASRGVIR